MGWSFSAINIFGVVSINEDQSYLIELLGVSTVFLFDVEESRLAQPRNLKMWNLLEWILAVLFF